jgi:uncharacterized protein YbaR (Trm112 family)
MKNFVAKLGGLLSILNAYGAMQTADGARDDMTRIVYCPKCRTKLLVAEDSDTDTVIRCGDCDMQFPLIDGLPILDFLENKLLTMLDGLLVFFLQRVPAWCYDLMVRVLRSVEELCSWLLPLSWKLLKVTYFLVLWLSILVCPTLGLCASGAYYGKFDSPHLQLWSLGLWVMGFASFLLIGTAYGWAYHCYRRKRKQSRMSPALPRVQTLQ